MRSSSSLYKFQESIFYGPNVKPKLYDLHYIDKVYLKSNRQGKVETQRAISFTFKAYNQKALMAALLLC